MDAIYQPRAVFLPLHLRKQRWACLVVHRRAGKTVACIAELITRAAATNLEAGRYAYVCPYRSQAKDVAWEYLKYFSKQFSPKVNESDLYIKLPHNGARITLYGADNPDSLRGIYLDGIVLDEYADMRPSIWGAIIRPLLTDRGGWAIFIGTPKGHNAFYDVYKRAIIDDEWFSILLPASRSGLLPDKELVSARVEMTEDQYAQEFECSFEASIMGAVYGKWMRQMEEEGRFITNIYDPEGLVHTAWDLGYGDATAIWFFQIGFNRINLIDYHEDVGKGMKHYCREVLTIKKREFGYMYGKHYGPTDLMNKLMAAEGRSLFDQAKECGYDFVPKAAPAQFDQIEAGRKALEITFADPSTCMDGIEALRQYHFKWDEDRKIFSDSPYHDKNSHACDAFEIIGQVWRNPVEKEEKPKPRFLPDATFDEVLGLRNRQQSNPYKRI